MVLGFMQFFDKQKKEPTHFREKILVGAGFIPQNPNIHPKGLIDFIGRPKIHTIRRDPHNRWKAGRKIEMVYRGAGYRIIDHFNKGIPELEKCVSVQKIEIKWTDVKKPFGLGITKHPIVVIDNARFNGQSSHILQLAINDGFKDLDQFFRWFNKDFSGNLIHWTDLKY